jgi:hypothetical protein
MQIEVRPWFTGLSSFRCKFVVGYCRSEATVDQFVSQKNTTVKNPDQLTPTTCKLKHIGLSTKIQVRRTNKFECYFYRRSAGTVWNPSSGSWKPSLDSRRCNRCSFGPRLPIESKVIIYGRHKDSLGGSLETSPPF